jgi:6,7-dimethyl-8-ribityllumazine synthase
LKTGESNGTNRLPTRDCAGKKFAIVAARFYRELTDQLIDGAKRALADCGVSSDDIAIYDVPGCFELPLACQRIIESENADAIVALGVVIRGETAHFNFVAGECARGIMDVQLSTGVPIGFGVLTTENMEQAEERADPKGGDKGYEAAMAAAALLHVPRSGARAGFRRA